MMNISITIDTFSCIVPIDQFDTPYLDYHKHLSQPYHHHHKYEKVVF